MDHRDRTDLISDLDRYLPMEGVSDFYFASGAPAMVRIHDELFRSAEGVPEDPDIRSLMERLLGHELPDALPLDGGIQYRGRSLRFNLDRRIQGLDLSLRPLMATIKPLRELGLPDWLYDIMQTRQGLVLICGATGSGKSTTLASLVEYTNVSRKAKIVMLEDPIEYVFEGKQSLICQREIDRDSSFLPALRSAMRQRPDIIVIGEIRDRDTAYTALQAAETGHLVLATLHADSVQKAVMRLRDMQPHERRTDVLSLLASTCRLILVQRLVRGKDGLRHLAYEICRVNQAVATLIRAEDRLHQLNNQITNARAEGSLLLNDSLAKLVKDAKISMEEARNSSYDPDNLRI